MIADKYALSASYRLLVRDNIYAICKWIKCEADVGGRSGWTFVQLAVYIWNEFISTIAIAIIVRSVMMEG